MRVLVVVYDFLSVNLNFVLPLTTSLLLPSPNKGRVEGENSYLYVPKYLSSDALPAPEIFCFFLLVFPEFILSFCSFLLQYPSHFDSCLQTNIVSTSTLPIPFYPRVFFLFFFLVVRFIFVDSVKARTGFCFAVLTLGALLSQ